jgi:hypothetical protein
MLDVRSLSPGIYLVLLQERDGTIVGHGRLLKL